VDPRHDFFHIAFMQDFTTKLITSISAVKDSIVVNVTTSSVAQPLLVHFRYTSFRIGVITKVV
jgi:hypothetical protein